MTQIINIYKNVNVNEKQNENVQTMTSLEIAELTGKQHNDLMKAIRKMEPAWVKIAQGNFSLGSFKDANGQLRPDRWGRSLGTVLNDHIFLSSVFLFYS